MNKTTYTGIDYGRGHTNRDQETKIRYGVIPVREIAVWFYSESEMENGLSCPNCGEDLEQYPDFDCDNDPCPHCQDTSYTEDRVYFTGKAYIKNKEYFVHSDCDGIDLWVEKSPYFTYAQFCSPCAPGACYLTSPLDTPNDNNKAYCLDHSWFDDEQAPYPVYSAETGLRVYSDNCLDRVVWVDIEIDDSSICFVPLNSDLLPCEATYVDQMWHIGSNQYTDLYDLVVEIEQQYKSTLLIHETWLDFDSGDSNV